MTKPIVILALAIGFSSALFAQDQAGYAQVSLSGPGGGKQPVSKDQFVTLVIDGTNITYDRTPIPNADVVTFVNGLLREKKVSYLGVYVRVGSRYGDVIRAVDVLRQTTAKNIGISMAEIPAGREP